MTDETVAQQPGREFSINRIYVKDISFETPGTPGIFKEEWKPSFNMNITSEVKTVGDDLFEVVLNITVTCKTGENTAFLVEVKQGGVFLVKGFPKEEMGPMLGAYCPNLLFPYAREVVSDLVSKGSFPQLLLTPVNFDAIYAQHVQRAQEAGKQQEGAPAAQETH